MFPHITTTTSKKIETKNPVPSLLKKEKQNLEKYTKHSRQVKTQKSSQPTDAITNCRSYFFVFLKIYLSALLLPYDSSYYLLPRLP